MFHQLVLTTPGATGKRFDWGAWHEESSRLVAHPELLDTVDIATIQKLFTTHMRAERLISGHLAGMINNGHILAILQRLAAIRAETHPGNR